jgi:putative transposase
MPERDQIYHIYNQGNNRQKLFHCRDNYLFFLQKIRKHIFPHCEIMAYCLMPNHFHLMIFTMAKYDFYCFHYIHQNPVVAGLVNKPEDWEFSSYRDYIGKRNGTLMNKKLTLKILDLNIDEIKDQTTYFIDERLIDLFES